MIEPLLKRLEPVLWTAPDGSESALPRVLRVPARYLYALVRDLLEGQLTLRAMSLVYTTLLSLVPLLAFSFSVLKGFGVHRQIEPLLYEFLQPLGEKGADITVQVIEFVDNVKGGVLGGIGLSLLIVTVISMVQKVEDSFNYVWQVQKPRSIARRFSDYLSVILVGPILMFTATGLMATVSSSEFVRALSDIQPFGLVLVVIGRLVPYVLVVLVFAFVYSFVPNTRVKFTAALVGAAVAGAAWSLTGMIFASFVVGSTRYAAIYSSFAIGLIALIWLYLSWLILLIGALIAFYVQHPEAQRSGRHLLKLSLSHTEELALAMMYRVGQAFRDGARLDFDGLSAELAVPARALAEIANRLEGAGLLVATEEGCFMPGRELNRISLEEILQAVRGPQDGRIDAPVQSVMASVRSSVHEGLKGRNLAGLVDESAPS